MWFAGQSPFPALLLVILVCLSIAICLAAAIYVAKPEANPRERMKVTAKNFVVFTAVAAIVIGLAVFSLGRTNQAISEGHSGPDSHQTAEH